MHQPVLLLKDVGKSFSAGLGKIDALSGVCLTIAAGEFVTVTGPSGSGKSTFINIAGCLDRPSTGSVYFDGADVAVMSDDERAALRINKIGIVFQQFNLLARTSALENVALPLVYAGVARRERLARAALVLERVGLAEFACFPPSQLSGGQQQRVAIARALINEPTLILADEPTGALDTRTSGELMDEFRSLHAGGITIVLVTHDRDIADAGTRRIAFRDGVIVEDRRQPSVHLAFAKGMP